MITYTEALAKQTRLSEWAKTLTEDEIVAVLNEMRNRGAAVAYYDAGEIETMYDGFKFATDPGDWMDENRAELEEAMCERAREMVERELQPFEPAE